MVKLPQIWANRNISRLALVSFWHVFIILWAHLSSSKYTYMYQFSWVTPLCLSLCSVHRVSYAIQPSHPLSSPFPPAFNLSLLPSIFPSIRVFSNESALHIRWPIYIHYISIMYEFTPSSNPKFRVYSGFLPYLICNSFLWQSESWFPLSFIICVVLWLVLLNVTNSPSCLPPL